jgi:hypothetical protein
MAMRLLQVVSVILWVLGYTGNGILFLNVYWNFTRHSFIQLFNPFLHLQVFGVLLTTPIFWGFLGMAAIGHYAVIFIDKYLEQRTKHIEETTVTRTPKRSQTLPGQEYNFPPVPTVLEVERHPHTPNTAQADCINTQPEERPFVRCRTDELEGIANSEWNKVKVLNELYHELKFRSRQKAGNLQKRISVRLIELQNSQFSWSSTSATPGSQDLSSGVFKYEEGLLKQYGYKVGKNGLPQNERWEILDTIFLCPLSHMSDSVYMGEWGEPKSAKRLRKLAESIAAFARNAKRRNTGSFSKAVQDWETDLEYLKKTYYNTNRFSFQYPNTK